MTHDELLAKISLGEQFEGATWRIDIDSIVKQLIALRAVVELHKPRTIQGAGWSREVCRGCDRDTYEGFCPTIQAIEKELE